MKRHRRARIVLPACAAALTATLAAAQPPEDGRFPWPSFRGPSASGIADGQDPPTEWLATLANDEDERRRCADHIADTLLNIREELRRKRPELFD